MSTPEPYYVNEQVTLYHGDCLEIDAWLQADVLVTDPPYGMSFISGHSDVRRPIQNDDGTEARDDALRRWGISRPAALFGTWKVVRPLNVKQVLVWHKAGAGPGMGDLATAFGTAHEEIYLFGEWPKKPSVKRQGSVLTTTAHPMLSDAGHPVAKPVGLMETLITSAPDGVIADPFAGSGSTLIAARNLSRKAIGVETVEKYCEIIARRLFQDCLELTYADKLPARVPGGDR